MNLGIGLGVTNYLRVPTVPLDPEAAIAALFESGEEGAWYDPSDLTTLYQDSAGTTPVTAAGQPVGLMLDKSKGLTLGSELVTNGTFDTDVSGWTGIDSTLAWSSGTLEITSTGGASRASQFMTTVVGKTYKATATLWQGTTSANISLLIPGIAQSANVNTSTPTTVSVVFKATATSTLIRPGGIMNVGETCFVDNISVKELPGNHATQSTSTARPTLQSSGGLYYLDFDGVDDWMRTTFASEQVKPNTISLAYSRDNTARTEFVYGGPNSTARHVMYHYDGDKIQLYDGTHSNFSDPHGTLVAVAGYNTTLPRRTLRLNGSAATFVFDGGILGSHNWGGITLGASYVPSNYLDGRIYSFVGVNRTLTAGEITDLETYLAEKTGFTAPVITGVPTIAVS